MPQAGFQCLTSLVSSKKTSCAIVHGLYTLCLIHPCHPHTSHLSMTDFNSLLVAKKNFGLISYFTQLKSLSLHFPPPLHCFFVFVFLVQFLICKRQNMRSYHSLMCSPISLQRVARYYKGTGMLPCYATLCCAMLCMLNAVAIKKMQG